MKLASLLNNIAEDLNDPDSLTWSRGQLARWFNEGRCTAFALTPDAFADVKIYKLEPGTEQELCDCDVLHDVLGLTDASGSVTDPMARFSAKVASRWIKKACQGRPSGMRSFSFEPGAGSRFSVRPPVLPGEDVWVKVICYGRPDDLDENDEVADCAVTAAAFQWVLFRAFMMDSEVVASANTAQVHAKMFFELLKLKFDREKAMELASTNPAAGRRTMASHLQRP